MGFATFMAPLRACIAGSHPRAPAGFLQMAQWALQKHRAYIAADATYKKLRRAAIVPFLL